MKQVAMLFMLVVLIGIMAGCKPGDYNLNTNLNVRDAAPEEKARAAILQADADRAMAENERQRAQNQIDMTTYAKTAEQNLELSRIQREAEIKAQTEKSTAEIQTQTERANVERGVISAKGQAEIYAIQVSAQAEADKQRREAEAIGNSLVALGYGIMIIMGGASVAFVVFALGHSAAHVRHQWALADILILQAEKGLPPLIITRSGYLLDTFTGERARLSDAAGINTLRLAAMTRLLETRALAGAAIRIGSDNRGRQSGGVGAANVLGTIAESVPQLIENEGKR